MPPEEINSQLTSEFMTCIILPFALPCSLFMTQNSRYQYTLTFQIEKFLYSFLPVEIFFNYRQKAILSMC